jgi:hypothetical protein
MYIGILFGAHSILHISRIRVKDVSIIWAWTGSWVSWRLRLPEFLDKQNMKLVRLSALHTGHLYPSGNILVIISVRG